ncbi:hypothetical protein LCGC14_0048140 [marine sediment metagenome]|uniref:Uncharacterized protein n=1 Tax=marine sediment metagenome TaxID=412755 RepID=A0A0F9YTI5_9ZZZZ
MHFGRVSKKTRLLWPQVRIYEPTKKGPKPLLLND